MRFSLLILMIVLISCKSNEKIVKAYEGVSPAPIFLDSIAASVEIVTDDVDRFFERVTKTEMSIQMKIDDQEMSRTDYVTQYKRFLAEDVSDFSESEKELVLNIFDEIYSMLDSINPELKFQNVELIKTKAKHYGPGVYYTREDKIVIPENELNRFNKEAFKSVMIHEFFHVYSRFHPEVRDELYELIGFKEVQGPIIFPDKLDKQKLLNPDGTTHYYISLETNDGKEKMGYPLISSNEDFYKPGKDAFFAYLDFQLYELVPMEDNVYKIILDEDGKSTINFSQSPSFFEQIKDNTSYIVHPDEIMADNFIYACFLAGEGKKVKKFSEAGLELINDVIKTLEK